MERSFFTEEKVVSTKETHLSAEEKVVSTKETHFSTKEKVVSTEETHLSMKEKLFLRWKQWLLKGRFVIKKYELLKC